MADSRDFVIGVVIGGVLGAAAALLLAPAAGSETRRVIRSRADQARDRTNEMAGEARGRASTVTRQVSERVSHLTEEAGRRLHDLREHSTDAAGRGRNWSAAQREALHSAFEAGRQAYAAKANLLREHDPAEEALLGTGEPEAAAAAPEAATAPASDEDAAA